MTSRPDLEHRVLVLAPSGADATVIRRLLLDEGVVTRVCADAAALARELDLGAGAAIVAEEALGERELALVASVLSAQPEWSDLPVILLTIAEHDASPLVDRLWQRTQNHVSVLERPIRSSALLATVHTALRARRRQYQVRDELARRLDAERSLRDSQERLRDAIAAADVGTWRVELAADRVKRDAHLLRILGLDADAATCAVQEFFERVHPADRPRAEEAWRAALDGGADLDVEVRVVRPDGRIRWIRDRGRVVLRPDGAPLYATGAVIDVTEQRLAEEALRETDRRKDEFLATLGHELRGPLAPLRTGLEILRQASHDRETVAETCAVLERQATQLTRLVDDLLDVSRITHGRLELRRTRVELGDVVRGAVEATRSLVDEARHELVVELPAEPVGLDADPLRLAQVLANLLSNAVKYTPEGGHIALRAAHDDGGVTVTVRDDGIGMPSEEIEGIFEMFRQIDRSLEAGFKGLGIGLALARSLVEMHGGRLTATSEGPGRGSEFRVWLPAASAPLLPARASAGDAPRARPAAHRVLVVDDNRDAARMLATLVGMLGHEVSVAFDGEAAVDAALERRPDLVLLDIGLPKRNGYEAARCIRAHPAGRDMVLAALTGWGQESDRRRAAEAGFDRHLTKPLDPAVLQELLAGLPASERGAREPGPGRASHTAPAPPRGPSTKAAEPAPAPPRGAPKAGEVALPEGFAPSAEPAGAAEPAEPESLGQLVHDLRGALNVVVLQLRVVEHVTRDLPEVQERVRKAATGGERLAALIARLSEHHVRNGRSRASSPP